MSDFKIIINGKEVNIKNKGIKISKSPMTLKDSASLKIFNSLNAIWALDLKNGSIAGVWRKPDGARIVQWCENFYSIQATKGDVFASESKDTVIKKTYRNGILLLTCKNKDLPGLLIFKKYWIEDKFLRRELKFKNLSDQKLFVTPNTEIVFTPEFRKKSYYLGGGFLGPLLASSKIKNRQKVTRFKNSTKVMVLSNPAPKGSFANYRNKMNGKFLFPWWQGAISGYTEKANTLYYTPQGWEMSLGTIDLEPSGGSSSIEDAFVFFFGNWFDFLNKVYASDKIATKNLQALTPAPKWVENVKLCMMYKSFSDVKHVLEMTDEGDIMILLTRICGSWADYRVSKGLNGFFGGKITGPELKELINKLHKLSPRIKVGIYQWISSVAKDSPLYKEHPEWFKKTDRYGNEVSLFPAHRPNYTSMINRPEVKQAMLEQFKEVKNYLGVDYIYLDETKTINQINWKTMELLRDDHWYDFWKEMRCFADTQIDFPLFFNGRGNAFGDINYIEAYHQLKPKLWRDFCGLALATEVFLKQRKGARIIPLYWTSKVDYINRVLALGWIPSNSGFFDFNRIPFINAAYEIGDCVPVNAKYSPDWKNDPTTKIESYSVKRLKGNEIIFSFINRNGKKDKIQVSIDLASINIGPEENVFIWEYPIDNIKTARRTLSQKELRTIYRKKRWRENLITAPRLLHAGKAGKSFKTSLTLDSNQMSQLVISKTAAGVYSSNETPLNYFFRASKKIKISGNQCPLHIKSTTKNAEIILFSGKEQREKDITVNGKRVIPELVYLRGKIFSLIKLGIGNFKVDAKPTLCKNKGKANIKAVLKKGQIKINGSLRPDAIFALVSGDKTLYTGLAPITIPKQRLGRNCTVKAIGYSSNKADIAIPSGKRTSVEKNRLTSYHPAQKKIIKTERKLNGATLLATATETGSWNNIYNIQPNLKPFIAEANSDTLTLNAGTTRKVEDFTGCAFAGFKFKGVKKLSLRLDNSFYAAVGIQMLRNFIKYRRSTREFAGIIVDYQSVNGFSKRVAFSVGVKNPKCNTPNPSYGKGGKPDQFVDLGNLLDNPSKTFTLNLTRFAPSNWNGVSWFSIGSDWVAAGRRLTVKILGINSKAGEKEIAEKDSQKIFNEFKKAKIIKIPFIPDFKWQESFDSEEWKRGTKINKFFILGGNSIPKFKTAVRLAYDENNLFISFRCDETIRTRPISASGEIWNSDEVELYILPPNDKMFHVLVDAAGEQLVIVNGTKKTNIKLKIRKSLVPKKHWDIMLAVPFSVIGSKPTGSWQFNICRNRPPSDGISDELSTWSPAMKKFEEPENFGNLIFSK